MISLTKRSCERFSLKQIKKFGRKLNFNVKKGTKKSICSSINKKLRELIKSKKEPRGFDLDTFVKDCNTCKIRLIDIKKIAKDENIKFSSTKKEGICKEIISEISKKYKKIILPTVPLVVHDNFPKNSRRNETFLTSDKEVAKVFLKSQSDNEVAKVFLKSQSDNKVQIRKPREIMLPKPKNLLLTSSNENDDFKKPSGYENVSQSDFKVIKYEKKEIQKNRKKSNKMHYITEIQKYNLHQKFEIIRCTYDRPDFDLESFRLLQEINPKILYFDDFFNSPINLSKLTNLKELTFGSDFNQTIDNLPPNLTHLELGDEFDQPVDHLPSSLTHLTFGIWFNQPIDHLPPNLVHLEFAYYSDFNQSIDHLPSKILRLILGFNFNQPINNLPPHLVLLKVGEMFNQDTKSLPPGVLLI